jgi:hypothetical protein
MYTLLWLSKYLTIDAQSIDEMIAKLEDEVVQLKAMRDAGVTLDGSGGTEDGYASLVTENPEVAKKFGFEEEEPYYEEDEGGLRAGVEDVSF